MNIYYEIIGVIDGAREVLFGSFSKDDCTYELKAERESWKDQGYTQLYIAQQPTIAHPDPKVYGKNFVADKI